MQCEGILQIMQSYSERQGALLLLATRTLPGISQKDRQTMRLWGACFLFIYLCIEAGELCNDHPKNHFEAPSVRLLVGDGYHREYRKLMVEVYLEFMRSLTEATKESTKRRKPEAPTCLTVIVLTQVQIRKSQRCLFGGHPVKQDEHDQEWAILIDAIMQFQETFIHFLEQGVLRPFASPEYTTWYTKFNQTWNAILCKYMAHEEYACRTVQGLRRLSQVGFGAGLAG